MGANALAQDLPLDNVQLDGEVALVTGGGRGIGRAIAQRLAAAGAGVAVLARTPEQVAETVALIEAAQGRALGCVADVTSPSTMMWKSWRHAPKPFNNRGCSDCGCAANAARLYHLASQQNRKLFGFAAPL